MYAYQVARLVDHGTVKSMTRTEAKGVSHESGSTTKFRVDTAGEGIMDGNDTERDLETAGEPS